MKKRDELQWKEFRLSDVFDISATPSGIDKNKLEEKVGLTPYITRTENTNGYELFVGKQNDKYKISEGNVITIGLDTQTVFYQPHSFFTGQNIQVLSNENLNKYNGLFVVGLIKRIMSKFNWGGNGATLTRLKRSQTLFPIKKNGQIDWKYMEDYMRALEKKQVDEAIEILKRGGVQCRVIKKLSECEWKEIALGDISDITCGIYVHDAIRIDGKTPYITSTCENNGIGFFIGNMNASYGKDVISVNRNGSVGYAFYHDYNAIYSYDCRKVKLNTKVSKYAAIFITNQIMQQKGKYEYGYKMGSERLRRQKILLPVNEKGDIDFEYMDRYMRGVELRLLEEYGKMLKVG